MEYLIKLIKRKYSVDVSGDKRALQKLRREAERAKRALSSQHQVKPHTHSSSFSLDSRVSFMLCHGQNLTRAK